MLLIFLCLVFVSLASDDNKDEAMEELMKLMREKGMGANFIRPKEEKAKFIRGRASLFCNKFKDELPKKECKREIVELMDEHDIFWMGEPAKKVKACTKTSRKVKGFGEAKKALAYCLEEIAENKEEL